ncbi:MAG: 2'-5' RNA ligase family protein [Acidimicrobiales bacterium]
MAVPERHQVVAPVTGDAGRHLGTLRQRHAGPTDHVPPHVVVAIDDELTDMRLVRARLDAAAARVPPFPLVLGAPEMVGSVRRGVHLTVSDPVGVWGWLREFLVAPPLVARDVVPHAPVVEPGASRAARRAWTALDGSELSLEFRVAELLVLVARAGEWEVDGRWPLDSPPVSPGDGSAV